MKESHSIDAATCTKCELCITICPALIIEKTTSGEIKFQRGRTPICIHCGHCMAMCESRSISIDGISYEDNFRELPQFTMDHETLMNFLLTRRSVRVFKNKPVHVEVIEKILEVISTAPFGVSPDNVEITAITDKSLIEKAAPEMSKVYLRLEKAMKIPFLGWMIRKSMPKEEGNTVMNFIVPHLAKDLYKFKDEVDDIARNAPALLLFHAPKGAEEHTVDAHIYLTYALLAVHSLGLGATAIGLIGPAINQSKQLQKLFRIPLGNEVVESMILGYPKLQFKRAIIRPRKNINYIT
jgi:nitroreductase/Pyruvate/2-oxoacid:ferredoxin oxidoreductase delta subunit